MADLKTTQEICDAIKEAAARCRCVREASQRHAMQLQEGELPRYNRDGTLIEPKLSPFVKPER